MRDGQLLEKQEIDKMFVIIVRVTYVLLSLSHVFSRHIPAIVVQGRYDVVCPVRILYQMFYSHLI